MCYFHTFPAGCECWYLALCSFHTTAKDEKKKMLTLTTTRGRSTITLRIASTCVVLFNFFINAREQKEVCLLEVQPNKSLGALLQVISRHLYFLSILYISFKSNLHILQQSLRTTYINANKYKWCFLFLQRFLLILNLCISVINFFIKKALIFREKIIFNKTIKC